MMDPNLSRIDYHANYRRRRCPRCRGISRLTHSILDPRHGNTVRLYHCAACGKHLWDDGSKFLAESVAALGSYAE
jgi:DNA-directed RNA polymerase subunit RPC12/RpoP